MGEQIPYFTVVMAAYNAVDFIEEALDSVQRQSFDHFECLVVDDGSTDHTPEILKWYEQIDRRFRHVTIPHTGLAGAARNVGVEFARGRYVAFLDSDDLWMPHKLQCVYEHIEGTGAEMIFSNGYVIDDAGTRTSRLLSPRMKRVIPARDPFMVLSNFVTLSSAVLTRERVLAHPFWEDEEIRGTEDYRLWLELNLEIALHYLPEPLVSYRTHAAQMHANYQRGLVHHGIVISGDRLREGYGSQAIELSRRLISLRMRYTEREYLLLLRDTARLGRGLGRDERKALIEYLSFGLAERSKTMIRQRLRGGLVRV